MDGFTCSLKTFRQAKGLTQGELRSRSEPCRIFSAS